MIRASSLPASAAAEKLIGTPSRGFNNCPPRKTTHDLTGTEPFPGWTCTRQAVSVGTGARWVLTHECGCERVFEWREIRKMKASGGRPRCGGCR